MAGWVGGFIPCSNEKAGEKVTETMRVLTVLEVIQGA